MTIRTKYNFGDEVNFSGGEKLKVISVHIYESRNKHTERYYFGNGIWKTIVKEAKEERTKP